MRKGTRIQRLLALVLAIVLAVGMAVPAGAQETSSTRIPLALEQTDESAVAELPLHGLGTTDSGISLASEAEQTVRVSIVLDEAAALEAGCTVQNVAGMAQYRQNLRQTQDSLQSVIERRALDGKKMDVVWNLTLAANIISANIPRSAIEKIAAIDGVKAVVEETRYTPDVVSIGGDYAPNMAVSSQMTGAEGAWLDGYTGAGTRVAIIDTGLDTDHQSFDAGAFEYGVAQAAEAAGRTVESYGLMGEAELAEKLTQLNAYEKDPTLTAQALYVNSKAPYGYNYIDGDTEITHDNDSQGEHGSHVAGIAAANRYVKQNGTYTDAMEAVHVTGNAPDAQILVMKVFGKNGGAYDSDIMAAMEDAIVLGADVMNLSLGSSSAGTAVSPSAEYQQIMESLVENDTVAAISAGNSGYWAENAAPGNLYSDGVNFATGGSPGSYTNAFTVASVDNDGLISATMRVGDKAISYSESTTNSVGMPYSNEPLASLDTSADGSGTEYPFVYVDGIGQDSDFEGIDLTGKVVFCSRGDIYYGEKANAVAKRGGAATVVYNTEPGTMLMDLTVYNYSAPAVFITQADGAAVKAAAQPQTTEAGLTYYTGTITVVGKVTGNYAGSQYQTMSSFSSWGVPGDLSLKPEITAPGGNIYSVNGGTAATDQYELMSGTSMAAPQITGMSALVQQYLRENAIEVSGMTSRALTQSLLMSTATPLRSGAANGAYYPVIQQGAGLANVQAAITSPTYLTVDGQPDGKVKVELGDDADRTGEYQFRFQLHNLGETELAYQLSGDLFTQKIENGYLTTNTCTVDAAIDFAVNGAAVMQPDASITDCDFNGDGYINRADAQALLDYVTGVRAEIAHLERADLSGDGAVSTYDVHLLLSRYQGFVTVPAGGSTTVDVTVRLSEAGREALGKQNYPTGAYLEGYIYATAVTGDDGELLPAHSIPVLGYYGSWSEPSMFDVGDYVTHANGQEPRPSYLGNDNANAVGIIYGDKPGSIYFFGGNPIVPDETYLPERNAINLERGDCFAVWQYAPIRNAAAARFTAVNTTTGEALCEEKLFGPIEAAFYYPYYGSWLNATLTEDLMLRPALDVGEYGEMTLTFATERHVDADGNVDWDSLAPGASMKMQFTVDNEAPEIRKAEVNTEKNVLEVTAYDDQYLAGVVLYDNTGRKVLKRAGADKDAPKGGEVVIEVPLEDVDGYRFVIQASDYAANFATYRLQETIGDPAPLPSLITYDTGSGDWLALSWGPGYYGGETLNKTTWSDSTVVPYAAAAVGEYTFIASDEGALYVAPADDLLSTSYICQMDYVLYDMTYDPESGLLYGVTKDGLLVSVDKLTGETEEIGQIAEPGFTNTVACDGKGNFYCGKLGTMEVYTFTLETLSAPEKLMSAGYYATRNLQSMAYDASRNVLCWFARNGTSYSTLDYIDYYEIDLETKSVVRSNKGFYHPACAMITPVWDGSVDSSWANPTYVVDRVVLDRSELTVLQGYTGTVSAGVLPWTLADKTVTYSSADPSIATVDDKGVVTGVSVGTTTIRAASARNSAIYDECTVTVQKLDIMVEGVLMDEQGAAMLYTWDFAAGGSWRAGTKLDYHVKAVTDIPGEDAFYLLSSDDNSMHKLDKATGKDLIDGSEAKSYSPWDMAYSTVYSTAETPKMYASRFSSIYTPDEAMNHPLYGTLSGPYSAQFVAIAAGGAEKYTYTGYYGDTEEYDTEVLYAFDGYSNSIYRYNVWQTDWGYSSAYSATGTDITAKAMTSGNSAGYSSMVVGSDGALYLSIFDGEASSLYRLVYDEQNGIYTSTCLGSFGDKVWPATLLTVSSNMTKTTAAPVATVHAEASEPAASAEPKAQADGGLHAVSVGENTGSTAPNGQQIQIDKVHRTISVPVLAQQSTNGLFELHYDASVLTLSGVRYGSVLHSADTAASGCVRIGYADAEEVNGLVAELTFQYEPSYQSRKTTITLDVKQDGTGTGKQQQVDLELPMQPRPVVPGTPVVTRPEPETEQRIRFDDVRSGDWYYEPVMALAEQGVINGVSKTRFAPELGLTRAMLVTILHRMEGEPAAVNASSFTDVKSGSWYETAVDWAAEQKIVTGYSSERFGPDDPITRQQLCAILWRYAKYKGIDVSANGTVMPDFADRAQIASWAGEAVSWAYSRGVMTGKSKTTLDPTGGATRAEAAVMLYRFMKLPVKDSKR